MAKATVGFEISMGKGLKHRIVALLITLLVALTGCEYADIPDDQFSSAPLKTIEETAEESGATPASALEDYRILSSRPDFGELENFTGELEQYGEVDELGRCTPAVVCLGLETVPTEGRGQIGNVMPTGYHSVQYDCVPGGWLYNRCHMVAFQLAGQNDNERNLITGTRRMNTVMQRFEDAIRVYIEGSGNHVMYRVSPDFKGSELVARGVRIEALSLEDDGAGIAYDIYIPNVQDGIGIDYATGDSWLESADEPEVIHGEVRYVLNTNTKKFHREDCSSVDSIKEKNREESSLEREEIIERGYKPCAICKP